MKHEIQFGDGLVRIRTSGRADVDGFRRYLKEMVDDPRWRPGTPTLVDHRELALGVLSSGEVLAIAREVASLADRLGNGRNATVVAGTLDFGLARMWELQTDDHVGSPLRIFQDPDEALRWALESD
ncbi:MAG: hypothetical protein HKP30_03685 [Myxococcales bacterium]|nr:hypothetical protein [Myxococcales bacterium]